MCVKRFKATTYLVYFSSYTWYAWEQKTKQNPMNYNDNGNIKWINIVLFPINICISNNKLNTILKIFIFIRIRRNTSMSYITTITKW